MPTRRQEKVARVIKEAVSDAITHHLNDPRVTGFVSVTRVTVAPDLRNAEVYLSIFSGTDNEKRRTFDGIVHARARIQSLLAAALESKFCPVLHLHLDEDFQKTLDTMRLIDQVASEHRAKDAEKDE